MTRAEPPARRGRGRRWGRRLVVVGVFLAVLLVIVRMLLPVALPPIVARIAAGQGLDVRWKSLQLALTSGRVELWHLVVRERSPDGTEPAADADAIADLEYAHIDLDVSALFTGDLRLERVELDGLDVRLEREEDGRLQLARIFASEGEPEPEPEPEPEVEPDAPSGAQAAALALDLPVQVDALRVQHVHVRVLDHSVDPPFDRTVQLSVRVSDLGSDERRTRLNLLAASPGVLDTLRVEGSGQSAGRSADARLDVEIGGLKPRELESQLAYLGIRPHARDLRLAASVEMFVEPLEGDELAGRGEVRLEDLALTADIEEAFAIDAVHVGATRIATDRIDLEEIEVRGVRGRAERLASGNLQVAGLELVPGPPEDEEQEPEPEDESRPGPGLTLALGRAVVADVALAFHDAAVAPPVTTELRASEISAGPIVLGPHGTAAVPPIELAAELAAPGVASRITLAGTIGSISPATSGSAEPPGSPDSTTARRHTLDLALAVRGLKPDRVAPYLEAAGIRSTYADGALDLRLAGWAEADEAGRLRAELALADLTLTDDTTLLAIPTLAVRDVLVDPEAALVRLGEVELAGLTLPVRRDPSGAVAALGLELGGAAEAVSSAETAPGADARAAGASAEHGGGAAVQEAAAPVESAESTAAPGSTASAPVDPGDAGGSTRFEIGRLHWHGTRIDLDDRALDPPLALSLDDLGLELVDLTLGGPADADAGTARLELWLRSEELVDELSVSGTVMSRPGPLDLTLDVLLEGRGITPTAVEPYLAEAGIESELADASLSLAVRGSVRTEPDGTHADLEVRDLAFENAGTELLALDSAEIGGLVASPGKTVLEDVAIVRPRIAAARDAEGRLHVLGLRLPAPAEPEEPDDPDGIGEPTEPEAAPPAPAAPEAPAEDAVAQGPPAELRVARVRVVEAAVQWSDRAVSPAVDTRATLDVAVDDLGLGPGAGRADVELSAHVADVLDDVSVRGWVQTTPDDLGLALDLEGSGVRIGPLATYLPEGISPTFTDGRLSAALEASMVRTEPGGHAARLELARVDWRDRDAPEPYLALEHLRFEAARIDPAEAVYAIDELSLGGVSLAARRTEEGALELLGLRLEAPAAAPAEGPPAGDVAPREAAPPVLLEPRERATLPTVTLGKLDLNVDGFRFQDASKPEAVPVNGRLRLSTPGPMEVCSPTSGNDAPIELTLAAAVDPLVGQAELKLEVQPFADDPRISVDLAVTGLEGAELTRVLPGLAERIDASALDDGRFSAHAETVLRWRRRGPTDFDLSRGFGFELDVENVALSGTPDGEVLAGLEAIHLDVAELNPTSGRFHAKLVEVVKPTLRATLADEGTTVAGVLLKPAGPEAEGAAEAPASAAPESVAAEDGADELPPELRIDRLIVDGIDVVVRDEGVRPPMLLPLTDLHIQLRGLTNRALVERRPIRFTTSVSSEPVELRRHERGLELPGKAVQRAEGVLHSGSGGEKKERKFDQVPVFDQVAVQGNVTLYPTPKGRARLVVSALELRALAGRAAASGITLKDGQLDTVVQMDFRESGAIKVRSLTTVANLNMSEPEGGLLARTLKLTVPTNTAIFLLRDRNGEIHLPVDFTVDEAGLQGVGNAAARATTSVVASAVANSPMRAAGAVADVATLGGRLTGVFGLGGSDEHERELSVELDYEPGVALLARGELKELRPLLEWMEEDPSCVLTLEHETGIQDIVRAEALANPTPEDATALAVRLQSERRELTALRDVLAEDVRSYYVRGMDGYAQATGERLRQVERQIGLTELALDEVYELLRAGAERRRSARTREATLQIAEERLRLLWRWLVANGPEDVADRISFRSPRVRAGEIEGGGRITVLARRR